MNSRALAALGIPPGPAMGEAFALLALGGKAGAAMVREAAADPGAWTTDACRGPLARALLAAAAEAMASPVAFRQWGTGIDEAAIDQMRQACALPVSRAGALMPDAHIGYGLPIGGVLATRNVVIPYAVGVDIACRVRLSVVDGPAAWLETRRDEMRLALEQETRFGVGATFRVPKDHPVLDEDWRVSPVTAAQKQRARSQLGTSGSGNHFVEFGLLTAGSGLPGLAPGTYPALLSHSGSRGTGAMVCEHYSRLAMQRRAKDLPENRRRLAWLDLDSADGQEYWAAMELMGRYASANHALIHEAILRRLQADARLTVENHHNFAWRETHGGEEVVVHRKGATPAAKDMLGVIPGSMASPGFVVRGLGHPAALESAAHGAGRRMSRKSALATLDWKSARRLLAERGVELISAGLDEVPMVYKDIHEVMAAQADLVEPLARFDPKIVKMCPAGERPED